MQAVEAVELGDDSRWFVVYTKPRSEALAYEHLQRQGFMAYLPRIRQPQHVRGAWRKVISPLFPRYLFVRLRPGVQDISPLRSTRGVTTLVRFGDRLAMMPPGMVEALRACEDPKEGMHMAERALFTTGEPVRIMRGAFAGLEGVFHAASGEERVVILLRILGRDASPVTLPMSHVEPVAMVEPVLQRTVPRQRV
ncbi:MAG: transcription/translation regulatory transformer protein RfaH [Gammaproteobacteria bacterium]|nr:transcription/translation regulatory transformer protein RfaH [Gammaproteobacteria bacterium]